MASFLPRFRRDLRRDLRRDQRGAHVVEMSLAVGLFALIGASVSSPWATAWRTISSR
jgi:Flp pilus assembly protein TadG